MTISPSKTNRGFAVIVALVAVTVLTLLAGAFAYSMKIETRLAANSNNDERLLWIGRAGVERARWILALEGQQPFSCKAQIWAGGPGMGPETNNSALAGISLDNYEVGEGTVTIKITELESKININRADTPLLQAVLTAQGADAGDISVVSDSILDWLDPDDGTRPAGAESDYYQGLNPPYYAKNAPMDDISELLLIKGVTLPMFKGGSDPNAPAPAFQQHRLGFGNTPGQAPSYPFGLADIFTSFSGGLVNLNTADSKVLSALPGMDNATVENILKFRAGPDGAEGTADDTPFTSVNQLAMAGVNSQAIPQISRYLTTRGDTYEVHATAEIGDYKREFVAVIIRNGPEPIIVRFYWK